MTPLTFISRLMPAPQGLRATALALALGAAFGSAGAQTAGPATEADLARRLDQLAAELVAVKAQLSELQKERATATRASDATVPAPVPAAPAPMARPGEAAGATSSQPLAAGRTAEPATVLSSYGEINLNRPRRNSQDTQADLRRFVLGFQHRLDERTKVVAELEVEHAVASAGDVGEVALEQAYVERQFHPNWAARGGLFLMPVGLLNENHEPTAYYGVERNFVETAIIPTTWREGGLQFIGNFDNGLTLQTGVSTGFNLNKWDATASAGVASPLGSIHQEMAQAKAHDLAAFGALNWRGVPGLQLGGSLFSGGASHAVSGAPASRINLWDVHARWTPGRWDLSALYAAGSVSNTAAWNTTLVGNPTLIPARFDGGYVQAAYKVWQQADYTLSPFVRVEQFNTGRSYAVLAAGLTPDALPTERVVTLGANFRVGAGVVLKADLQRFKVNTSADRLNLGLGWSF